MISEFPDCTWCSDWNNKEFWTLNPKPMKNIDELGEDQDFDGERGDGEFVGI